MRERERNCEEKVFTWRTSSSCFGMWVEWVVHTSEIDKMCLSSDTSFVSRHLFSAFWRLRHCRIFYQSIRKSWNKPDFRRYTTLIRHQSRCCEASLCPSGNKPRTNNRFSQNRSSWQRPDSLTRSRHGFLYYPANKGGRNYLNEVARITRMIQRKLISIM